MDDMTIEGLKPYYNAYMRLWKQSNKDKIKVTNRRHYNKRKETPKLNSIFG